MAAVIFLAGAVWSFLEIADEVMEGESRSIDTLILLSLRNPDDLSDPLGPPWLEETMRDFTALGGVAVLTLLTLFSVVYLFIRRQSVQALFIVITVVTATILNNLLKWGFDRPRPDLVPHGSIVYTASFPSGHALTSATVYLTIGALLASAHRENAIKLYLIGVAVLLAVLVGVSRVYLGVHWPTDVLAGGMAGGAWALLLWLAARWRTGGPGSRF